MKVIVKTGFFNVGEYSLTVSKSGIRFHSDSEDWQVAFSELIRLSVFDSAGNLRRFTMETKDAVYDGKFKNGAEAKSFMEQLNRLGGKKLEISFTGEKSKI